MIRYFFAAATLCVAGCAPAVEHVMQMDTEPRTISVDGFDLYERAQVLRAVNEWNGKGARLTVVDGSSTNLSIVANRTPYEAKANLCGVTINKQIAAVYMNAGCDLCATARHEIGHLLGLGHSHGGWMHPSIHPSNRCGS